MNKIFKVKSTVTFTSLVEAENGEEAVQLVLAEDVETAIYKFQGGVPSQEHSAELVECSEEEANSHWTRHLGEYLTRGEVAAL